uniref:Retrotransposon Copia-like N-terminal domain-containing protein n=1 Tax=Fagus sylvatica TaxID=28930 RepID=A0A2N9HMG6_FAGSY
MGSTSGHEITCPIIVVLDGPTSYYSWSQNMIIFLKGRQLWRYVIGDIPKPVPRPITNSNGSNAAADPPLKYAEDINLFAKYKDRRRFTQFMIGLREDFEPTRASLLSRSHLPSLDVAVKELISEENQRLHHHLSSSNVVLATPRPPASSFDRSRCICKYCKKPSHDISECFCKQKDDKREQAAVMSSTPVESMFYRYMSQPSPALSVTSGSTDGQAAWDRP